MWYTYIHIYVYTYVSHIFKGKSLEEECLFVAKAVNEEEKEEEEKEEEENKEDEEDEEAFTPLDFNNANKNSADCVRD